MIFAVPNALCAWPAMNSRATDAAIGSLPLNLGSFARRSVHKEKQGW
jgi:hypothetical protein